ncbi:Calcium-binding acidic-repeat protein precursor (ARP) [hydrothermal vent metagenome]|uniref:Calcium-binding acidic-repeat protein (ARP) n=1 Tax=hydrothermal vent metagenome TaxID=652676 RepID=A0A1W1CPE0_9ZZZZ
MSAYATLYEDAEDGKQDRWRLYNDISTASLKNIYDEEKESRVIFLDSQDNQSGYMLAMERNSTAWCRTKGKSLRWSMKSDRDFVILVSIQTDRGHRYIVYTSGDRNGRGYYGLGADSVNGEWHKFSRDLDLDLKRYEPTNQIIAVDSFFVRGNVKIDDIEIVDINKRGFIPKKIESCVIDIPKINPSPKNEFEIHDNEPPKIKLNGYPVLSIGLGEEYIEQGATAMDNVDGSIPVEISEEIDINRVGTYTRFYIARDSVGNSAITTRIINVGSIKKEKQEDEVIEEELATLESVDSSGFIKFPSEDDY